jgi:glycosyltransferase involved in cell wall biosynthesis
MSDRDSPELTVIVPALNAMHTVRRVFEAVIASDLARDRFELILVDDGSTDETSLVGAEYCDRVVRLSGRPHGPAFARNRAAEVARGEILVFVDSDVLPHPDALRRIAEHFRADSDLASVFGSYDAHPEAPGLVSQYRNLMHHYVHHRNAGPAQTFWAGLGAIRRSDFLAVGMFDEWHYGRPQIEDIELGRRLHRTGHKLLLDPTIQGTHLKRWTMRNTLAGDFQHRGIPWMWLILVEESPDKAQTLNVRTYEKVLTGVAGFGMLMPPLALVLRAWWPLWVLGASAAVILASNLGFYRFLAGVRGHAFAFAAVPLHLLYYGSNALSVVTGWLVHALFGEPIPPADVTAHAQIGIPTWPPAPRRSEQSIWESPPGGQAP